MPNHVTNILRINAFEFQGAPAGLIDEAVAAVKSDDSLFDFNRIVPMPPGLMIASGSVSSNARALFDDKKARQIASYPWAREHAKGDLGKLRDYLRKQYLQHPEEGFPTLDDFAERIRSNITKHGAESWYEWSCAHWGTKWNAYSVTGGKTSDHEATFHFETAWAPPIPVIDALAARFPKLCLRLIWCDEGDDKAVRVYWEKGKRETEDED